MKMFRFVVMMMALGLMGCSGCSVLGVDKGDERPFETPLPINTAHKKLALGIYVTVGIKDDGTVWSWGSGYKGELGHGKRNDEQLVPKQIEGMTDFIEIAGSGLHFLALRNDGTVWSWGDNTGGQLGYEAENDLRYGYFSSTPKKIEGLNNIKSIAAGLGHSLALDVDGNVYAFGSNLNNQFGINNDNIKKNVSPSIVLTNIYAEKVVADSAINAILKSDGSVVFWGTNSIGLLNGSVKKNKYSGFEPLFAKPSEVEIPVKCADFVVGPSAVFCLANDGSVWARGMNNLGGLGQGDTSQYESFVRVKNIGRIISLASSGQWVSALDQEGNVWEWGISVRWPFRAGWRTNIEPYPIKRALIKNAIRLYAESNSVVSITSDGAVFYWGSSEGGKRGIGQQGMLHQTSKDWVGPVKSLWQWK